ncbi:hypothetical protein ACHWQZ_G011072 [Mnemiopsis leidyi]
MKLRNVAVTTGCVLVFLVLLTRNLANGIEYCDCTNVYKASLPNGSHCANDTTFNTWTLACDPKPAAEPEGAEKRAGNTKQKRAETGAESEGETTTAVNLTEVALQLEQYKKTIHNYTAYNATLYPLNSTCECNCTYGSYTNDTIYFIDSNQTATTTKVTESTKTVGESTVVTKITVTNNQYIQGWWKINSTTTTNVTTTTTGGITEEAVSSSTKADNVSSHWLEVITVVGQCPLPEVIGLQCYNCLFVPSMNYSACLDPNKNCPYRCSKTVYQYLGIDYFVSSCYNDSRPNDCSSGSGNSTTTDVKCAAELCATDWCNTYVPLAGDQLVPNSLLLLLSFSVTVLVFKWSLRTV